jgi:hypothetical protein
MRAAEVSEDANNGVAHDDGNWFFTNEEQIIKSLLELLEASLAS